jgi:hypothetical protein
MKGMHRHTGQAIDDVAHLKQSLHDILTTPLGSRVMRPDYGSRLFELIDAPLNQTTLAELYAATAQAIARWEPRFKIAHIHMAHADTGNVTIDLQGTYVPTGEPMIAEITL